MNDRLVDGATREVIDFIAEVGTHRVEVTAFDNSGSRAIASMDVEVSLPNEGVVLDADTLPAICLLMGKQFSGLECGFQIR